MKKLIRYINNNVLIEVAQLNSVTVGVRVLAGIITSKMIAVFIGVEGMALIGNLRNFVSATHSFAILGIYRGLVKYISKFKKNSFRLSETISTAYYSGFFVTMFIAFMCYYNADSINRFLFSDFYNFDYIIEIFALALPFYSLNMFCFSILNGFSKYKMLLVINIIGQVLGLLITILLIYQNNIDGALISAVISPSIIFLITVIGIVNRKSLVSLVNIKEVNYNMLRRFSPYAVMAIVTTVAMPLTLIFIRNYIISSVGLVEAGYWEAMNRISDYYLMFVNSIMALYIIPKFRDIHEKELIKKELISIYKSIMPIIAIGMAILFILKGIIIKLIFSHEFLPTKDLFLWQMLGDFLKVMAMIIAYQFIAKRMFLHFVIIEIFLILMLYLSSILLVDIYGLQGAVIGHFVSYLMQFGIIVLLFSSSIFSVLPASKE